MKNIITRAKNAISGENGGPSVEQVIGIAVALIIGSALLIFGGKIQEWVTGASGAVDNLENSLGNGEDIKSV